MTNSPESNAEIQIKEAIKHMSIMVGKQKVVINDAKYLISTACKLLYKCEELRISRDKWSVRAKKAESKLK